MSEKNSGKNKHGKSSLSVKLIVYLCISLFIIFGILTYLNFMTHRRHLEAAIIDAALRIADTIDKSLSYNMLNDQCSEAFKLIETMGSLNGIEKIRIFNKDGEIEYSTQRNEISTYVNKEAEACYICHSSAEPLQELDHDKRWRIFRNKKDERILGLINPIKNEPKCYNAACHYHPGDIKILGVLDVNMTLEEIDTHMAGDVAPVAGAFLITMIIVVFISGAFITIMVHKPVHKLIESTKKAARGDLDQEFTVDTNDELGQLTDSFKQMIADLKIAREKQADWSKTLEKRVKEKSEELKKAHTAMLHIEKMASLGKLSAIVAHEINNPLAGVYTYAKILKKKLNAYISENKGADLSRFKEALNQIEIIEKETLRCGDIVKNLLIFSKKTPIDVKKNDINDVMNASIKLVNHQIELAAINLTTDFDENLPLVTCDKGQIQQVVVALLINAIEASSEEGDIYLSTRADDSSEEVIIEIKDTGSGMDEETISHIFEPFFTTKHNTSGSGLGLAVTYSLVEQHGGTIDVESEKGQGSTFKIRLPIDFEYKPPEDDLEEKTPPERI